MMHIWKSVVLGRHGVRGVSHHSTDVNKVFPASFADFGH